MMMQQTAHACAVDAGIQPAKLADLDALVVVNSVGPALLTNPPAELAARLGAGHCRQYHTVTGGNTPQMLVNHFCAEIARGKVDMVLLSGAEALDSLARARKNGVELHWEAETTARPPVTLGDDRPGSNAQELAHGMLAPILTYPLFENALRSHYGIAVAEHQRSLGQLLAPFTTVARDNPYAWFPKQRSAGEISRMTAENRYVGFPYTKYMNAVMQVNQSASVLLTSDVRARALGIDRSRWVYLHGYADMNDIWNVTERINFHSSPAIERGLASALEMARTSVDEVDHLDVYSCFPAVLEITRDALGMRDHDPRLLTVTGGLPYFGGAGNNYSMHAIATMMDRLRQAPGQRGLVTANGWYLTKHAIGIYSTSSPEVAFEPPDSTAASRQISSMAHPQLDPVPSGPGTVETYTVMFGRDGEPAQGLVLGQLDSGRRFVALTPDDRELLNALTRDDPIGRRGRVDPGKPTNHFAFDQ
ncbi:MAG: acetyl-CoA acetyltransferase [Pseudomonadales bacterium]